MSWLHIIGAEQGGELLHLKTVAAPVAAAMAGREKLVMDGTYLNRVASDGTFRRVGHIYLAADVQTAQVGTNNADTNEKTLLEVVLPAGEIAKDNWGILVKAAVTFSAAIGNKTSRIYFGATAVASNGVTPAATSQACSLCADVIRLTATTQRALGATQVGAILQTTTITSPAENMANGLSIKLTGQNGLISQGANTVLSQFLEVLVVAR